MKLFYHFSVHGFSNSYVIGPEGPGDAIVVDPGVFDDYMLNIIEGNRYYLRHILVTHNHLAHIEGITTLLKVYDAQIYANLPEIMGHSTKRVKDNDTLELSGFKVKCIQIPGHSSDSIVYKLDHLLFTGDVIEAGAIGSTSTSYAKAHLKSTIQEKLFNIQGSNFLLPGHGPPSTIESEKLYNNSMKTKL